MICFSDCLCYSIRKSIIIKRSLKESALSKNWLIVKDAGFKGNGLFCDCKLISKGSLIGEYIGEELSLRDYLKRYPSGESVYTFILSDEEKTQRRDLKYLDAANVFVSNILRFINHDDDPNLDYFITRKCDRSGNIIADVKFYANKDIHYGDELLFDYGVKYKLDYAKTLC